MTTGERMKARRKEIGLSAETVAEKLGVSPATIYRYENGDIEKVPGKQLGPISEVLQTTPAFLMGWEDSASMPSVFSPLPRMKEWAVLGATACGKPIHEEIFDETVTAPEDIKADVVFRCKGDSMINARIFDGDLVFVRLQPEVENGQIAVVRIDDEYTLKRFYADDGYVELRAENPTFPPIILRGAEADPDRFEVVGLAVAFLSSIQ